MSDSETEIDNQNSRRESKRIKASTLNNEIADVALCEVEGIENFFTTDVHSDDDINKFTTKLNSVFSKVQQMKNELISITDNQINNTTLNILVLYSEKFTEASAKLSKMLENNSLTQELSLEETQLKEAEEAFKAHVERFNRLKARITANGASKEEPEVLQVIPQVSDGVYAVKELTSSLIATMKATKRSTLEPIVFDGNPLDFHEWEIDFDAFVESEGLTGIEPLRYLKKYVKGKAKEAIVGYFITNTLQAYQGARRELKDRFGSKYNVSRALRQRLTDWPRIGSKDGEGLRKFADFLSQVKSAMRDIPELHILNDCQENEKLVQKLPEWLVRMWARIVKNKRTEEFRYPTYKEFTEFIVDQAEILDEPVMKLALHKSTTNNSSKRDHPTNLRTLTTATERVACKCCNKRNHPTAECFTLESKSKEEKEAFIRENKLCYGCLQYGHRSKQCQKRATCKKCNKRHPSALHRDDVVQTPILAQNSLEGSTIKMGSKVNENEQEETKALGVKATKQSMQLLSMIMPVYVSTTKNPSQEILVYALLDTQSDSSYLVETIADQLKTTKTKENVTVETMNGETPMLLSKYTNLRIRGYENSKLLSVTAYSWKSIPCDRKQIPTCLNVTQFPHLEKLASKIPSELDIPVGLLLGANCPEAFVPLEVIAGKSGEPFAQRTSLGWAVLGGSVTHAGNLKINYTSTLSRSTEDDTLMSQDDFKFIDIMEKGICKMESGSYMMPLPFKERPILPNNRRQAERRLHGLKRKFDKDTGFRKDYQSFMNELIEKGHAELVPQESNQGEVWYIPHFAVAHPKKKKLRVVFDCSATFADTSINEHLIQGPDMINSLLGILCRFRKEYVAISCDVEKMFYNFYVKQEDRDYLRFLWYGTQGNILDYRMTVHLFGATSSPAVATYGLRNLAEENKESHPKAAEFIQRNFYVDDGITSVSSIQEANTLIDEVLEVCRFGNLRLHKFVSNKPEALKTLPESEKLIQLVDLFKDTLPNQRTLGLEWNIKSDTLRFSSQLEDKPMTRRGVLSVVSQLYDPLGLLAPFTLKGKNILQKVNQAGTNWDEGIPSPLEGYWHKWLDELPALDTLEIPRCMKPEDFGQVVRAELHHFSDASDNGIGACSYIRFKNECGLYHSSLVLAKSKVVPTKGIITIPRLELMGAVLACRLSSKLKKELDMNISTEYFWTDSRIVLGYIANSTKRFQVFVANRVRVIREWSSPEQWNFIDGTENPADIASRGLECSKLAESIWFTGPDFLKEQSALEQRLQICSTMERAVEVSDPEVKKSQVVHKMLLTPHDLYERFERYSSLHKLKKAFARLIKMAKNKHWKIDELDDLESLQQAECYVIKVTQLRHYYKEIKDLQGKQTVSSNSSLVKLNPYIDSDGLLRLGGRAKKSSCLSEMEKYPVIIPKKCHLARLMVLYYHEKSHHLGKNHTLAAIRQAGYWLVGATRLIKEILNGCVTCKKLHGKPSEQMMGLLPEERLQSTAPFTHVGMDVFGPFYVRDRRTELKRYGLLFTCMYSRAVHVESLDDLTTDGFLNALRCFISLRGNVRTLYSDNGTNFVGARNELTKMLEAVQADAKNFISEANIQFKTTSPKASHQGGVWERQIRSIRSVMEEMMMSHKDRLDSTSLRTLFYEAAATINSRPLSTVSINEIDDIPLTPNMILTGKTGIIAPPSGEFPKECVYGRARWKRVQCLAEEFWRRWKAEYLCNITIRQKWNSPKSNIEIGDKVLIASEELPRNRWCMGVIENTLAGDDGLVRNCTIRLGTSFLDSQGKPMEPHRIIKRPIQKLIKLL